MNEACERWPGIAKNLGRACAPSLVMIALLGGAALRAQTPLPIIREGPASMDRVETLPPLLPRFAEPMTTQEPLLLTAPPNSKRSRGEVIRAHESVVVAPQPTTTITRVLNVKSVPISLDAVLQLAQDQNGQIRLAREKLYEAHVEYEIAGKCWVPDLTVGAGYWRHEGGIQDFDGRLVKSSYGSTLAGLEVHGKVDLRDIVYQRLDAARKVYQQEGELSRFSSEQLLDAASTYIDLLTTRSAEAIGLEAERKLLDLLEQSKSLAKIDSGVQIEVSRVEAELGAQKILTRKFREGAHAAAAKLIYVLNLDPSSELVPVDKQMVAFRLVDVEVAAETLVEQALRSGPGVRELEGILGILEEARSQRLSPLHLLPTFEVRMTEGAFEAGPDSRLDWANRWDLGVQARWNLTELLSSRGRKRLADTKIAQAHLTYQELRGKLTLGVQEAAESQRSGMEQMSLAAKQIQHAEEAFHLSDTRLRQNIKGRSPSEVLLAIRTVAGARFSYLHAVRDLDKAQLRLFVLTGGISSTSH